MKHNPTRRRLMGATLAATGALLTGLGFAGGQTLATKGKIMLDACSNARAALSRLPPSR